MTPPQSGEPDRITPEELTAFIDGALQGPDAQRVEVWLRTHPEAAAEVDAQRRLLNLWQRSSIPEPDENRWDRVADALGRFSPDRPSGHPRRPPGWRFWAVFGAGIAAATLLAIMLERDPAGGGRGRPQTVFQVAEEADVEILSLLGDDRETLVVGKIPLERSLILASAGDVELQEMEADSDGMVPNIRIDDGVDAPMVLVPLGSSSQVEPR